MFYNLTRMEKWITDEYVKSNIYTPEDINIERLAHIYNVTVWKFPMEARYDIFDNKKYIVIDSRSSFKEQREQFFHELCHVLFHVGHQSEMNESFRELLEWEADSFVMYAALPYFMLKQCNLSSEYLVHDLSIKFGVTAELCQRRLEQIKNRIQSNSTLVAESSLAYNVFR